jgi:hypothetical protein
VLRTTDAFHFEVYDMTQFFKFRILSLGAGLATMAVLATLAQSGRAQAASGLSQCTGSSSQSVINCCNGFVSVHPQLWMRQTHTSCRAAVACRGSRASLTSAARVKICSIQQPVHEVNSKEHESSGKQKSDIRLKTDIHRIGTTVLGLPLYTFQYRNQVGAYVGVMAQDVLKVEPSAVSIGADGYYRVDYGKLGIAMERIQ